MLEADSSPINQISIDVRGVIEREVLADIALIQDEDSELVDFYITVQTEYRSQEYLFLRWLDSNYTPDQILYPGSGSDIIPKLAFGSDKVVHTSLERYDCPDDSDYFIGFGEGNKIISRFNSLPFPNSAFPMVFLAGLSVEMMQEYLSEFIRLIKDDGLLVLAYNCFVEGRIDFMQYKELRSLEIPSVFQDNYDSETEFIVLRKMSS